MYFLAAASQVTYSLGGLLATTAAAPSFMSSGLYLLLAVDPAVDPRFYRLGGRFPTPKGSCLTWRGDDAHRFLVITTVILWLKISTDC